VKGRGREERGGGIQKDKQGDKQIER